MDLPKLVIGMLGYYAVLGYLIYIVGSECF